MKPRLTALAPRVGMIDTRRVRPAPKQVEPIYKSAQYQAWRAAVIARASGRCQRPGCGRAERRMFADHIVELRDGGAPFDVGNGQCLCGSCHTAKTVAARAARATATP